MTYLRARYYDSEIKRFTTEDPAHDGLNWYAYCGNDPVNFVDPWGLKLKVATGDEDTVLAYLNQLSRDTLAIDDDGYVYIAEWNPDANDRSVGTELIWQLISNENECEINLSSFWPISGTNYTDEDNTLNPGVGSDAKVTLSTHTEYALVGENGEKKETPMYIKLGHELIHALRGMKGHRKDRSYEGIGYTPYGYEIVMSREEFEVTGISYREINNGEWKTQPWVDTESWYFTEKSLREENGLPRRVM